MQTKIKLAILELIAGIFGWVWLISSLAGLYFFAMAIFFDGLWSQFFWAFGIGVIAKWLAKGFEANKKQIALETLTVTSAVNSETFSSEKIIRDFAGCIEDNPFSDDQIVDANQLPHSKETIYQAFVEEFASNEPKFNRVDLLAVFLSLAHFQEGVGPNPISYLGVDFSNVDFSNMDLDEKSRFVEGSIAKIKGNPHKQLAEQLWPLVEKELEEYAQLVS